MNLKNLQLNGAELVDPNAEYSAGPENYMNVSVNQSLSQSIAADDGAANVEADCINPDRSFSGDIVTSADRLSSYSGVSISTNTGAGNLPAGALSMQFSNNVAAAVISAGPDAADTSAYSGTGIAVHRANANSVEHDIRAASSITVKADVAAGSISNYIAGYGALSYTGFGVASDGSTYYRVDNTSLRAIDAEKSSAGDKELCWAATATNMLYWAGWGKNVGSLSVKIEDDLFDYYKKYFTDAGSFIDSGINWFMSGKYDNKGNASAAALKPDIGDGGGFFKSVSVSSYLTVDSKTKTVMSSIEDNLKAGNVCGLTIVWDQTSAHAVTCWGYGYDASVKKNSRNYYTGIYISDSDDDRWQGRTAPNVIRYCPITWNRKMGCYTVTYEAGTFGFLTEVVGLKRTYVFNVYDAVSGDKVQGGTQTVFAGGNAVDGVIGSGGSQIVSGGTTSGTLVNSGGSQLISAGTATGTVINSGGYETVSSGGTAADATVNAGGSMNVSSGGIVSGTLNVSGGHVILDNTDSLNGMSKLSYALSKAKTDDVLITVKVGILGTWTQIYTLNVDNTAKGSYVLADGADLSGMNGNVFTITYNSLSTSLMVGSSYVFADGNKLSLSLTRNGTDRLTATFTADTVPPQAPAGMTRTVTGRSAALDWNDSSDADSRVRLYEVRVDNNANFSSPEYTAAPVASGITFNKLTDGTYYWAVRSRDLAGNYSAWSSGSSFTVDATAPSVPSRLTRNVSGNSVTLDWSDAKDSTSGVKQYEVQIDNTADFSSPEYTATTAASSAIFNGLADGGYLWRVRTQDRSGNFSAWSAGSGFACDLSGNTINDAVTLSAAPETGWVGFGDAADYYKITMTNAGELTLNLTNLSGDANLYLLDVYGSVLKTSAKKGAADEAINGAALLEGTYFVKVATKSANTVAYTLTNAEDYYPADIAGNTMAAAQDIATKDNWVGLGDSDDYYRFDLTQAAQSTLKLNGITGGNADLSLYDVNGRLLKKSARAGAGEELISTDLAAGTYFARVNAVSGSSIDYTLDFNKKVLPGILAS
ncbi:MAG: pre-peptidase C-terminal domain-containing protein [Victivallaceae bacterium]